MSGVDLSRLISGIYVIADNSLVPNKSHLELARSALEGGVKLIQFRAKNLDRREFYQAGLSLSRLCREYDALLIINDDLEKAKQETIHLIKSLIET